MSTERKRRDGYRIYHNPRCSNSRGALELLRARGIEPEIVPYLDTPPDHDTLRALVDATGGRAIDLVRTKEPLFAELGLDRPDTGDDALIDAMASHPVLINRPIVVTPAGTRLCRPPERLLDLLPPE